LDTEFSLAKGTLKPHTIRLPQSGRKRALRAVACVGAALLAAVVAGGAGRGAISRPGNAPDQCPEQARIAGPGWCGDRGPATAALLAYPGGVAALRQGGFVIADTRNNVVRRVSSAGTITRIAGIGLPGERGDGGLATAARLTAPTCVIEASDGAILVRDQTAIRRISPRGGITSVDGPDPCVTPTLPSGERLIVDTDNSLVERVRPGRSTVVVAGDGGCGYTGDGVPATTTALARPRAVALMPDGGFLIADTENHIVRRVAADGTITTVAGHPPPLDFAPCGASGEYGTPIYLVLLLPLRGEPYRWPSVRYETTYDVSLLFTIRRRSRVVAQIRREAKSGLSRTKLRVALAPGGYTVDLRGKGVALAAGGEKVPFTKHDVERLVIARRASR
jgi:hypothetical protein